MDLKELETQTRAIVVDVIERSAIKKGQLFVLGLSSSEVIGGNIGENSSAEVGEVVVSVLLEELGKRGIHLAVQGCEHLNRALVVEREVVEAKDLEIVNVIPNLHAGGCQTLWKLKKSWLMLAWILAILLLVCTSNASKFL